MTKLFRHIIPVLLALFALAPLSARAAEENQGEGGIDVKEIIFEHLGDGYGWEVPFFHEYRIPLPVIVRAENGSWHCFSSSRLSEFEVYEDAQGKEKHRIIPVPVTLGEGADAVTFMLAKEGDHKNKVVQLVAPVPGEPTITVDGKTYSEYKPYDISITKNVLALLIAAVVVTIMVMCVVRWYRKHGMKAPRKGNGFIELIVEFVYINVIKDTLGKNASRFAPYLLTAFFFILVMNLLGLIVIFPGGANLTGNIAITLVLAVMTFVITNVKGTKHYWKEIFWPDVPIWLKCPIPIMQFIEIFGIFTKPAALCVRLFANMMGGHMIVITLVLLIFIFGAFGAAAAGGVTVISILFTIFMLALDCLVSLIQAYVFTMLSTLFISMAVDDGHHEPKAVKEVELTQSK